MENWLLSVHSDGTEEFVSNLNPNLSEKVKIRIRFKKNSPVNHVLLLSFPNGEDNYTEMRYLKTEHGLDYYEAELEITENRIAYQF